ncbi:hypothetical protein SAMD00019534_116000, partial [Acytostelium subglobosum LB1]|uniref:hypothetical protein n=1 Tax=Acytostelium subglobosum LB1 TaxID=1410327 RepID=UPI00064495E2
MPDEELISLYSLGIAALIAISFLSLTIIVALPALFKRPIYLRSQNRVTPEHRVLIADYFIFALLPSVAIFIIGSSIIRMASFGIDYFTIGIYPSLSS